MHVLILPSFYPDPERPVIGIFFKDQAKALSKSGVNIGVAYVEPRSLRILNLHRIRENHFQVIFHEEDGLPTLRMHGWNPLMQTMPGGLIWSLLTQFVINRYVERFGKPDLIHAHNSLWAGYAAAKAAKRYRVPYVITEHASDFIMGTVPYTAKRYVSSVLARANAVVSVSQGLADAMRVYCGGREIKIVPNVVNTDFFSLSPIRSERPPFVFLGIAHLVDCKGIHILINAFAKKFKDSHDVRLEIGGTGPQRQELEVLCKRLGIEDRVNFLGPLSREQVKEAMWRAHAFVLPSFHETFGVVLIEAMSTGLPVIATHCGGPENIVNPDVGLLVKPGDDEEMAKAMQTMLDNSKYSDKKIRDYTVSHYGELAVAGLLRDIYENVVSVRKLV